MTTQSQEFQKTDELNKINKWIHKLKKEVQEMFWNMIVNVYVPYN